MNSRTCESCTYSERVYVRDVTKWKTNQYVIHCEKRFCVVNITKAQKCSEYESIGVK